MDKLKRHNWLLWLGVASLLVSCESGILTPVPAANKLPAELTLPAAGLNSAQSGSVSGKPIALADLDLLNPGIPGAGVQSSSPAVRIVASNLPAIGYLQGIGGNNYWVSSYGSVKLTLTFLQAGDYTDFHLSDIVSTPPGDFGLMGHVGQVDSSQCDSLVATGWLAPMASCYIKFTYVGDQMLEIPQTTTFYFKWAKQQVNWSAAMANVKMDTQNQPLINARSMVAPAGDMLPSVLRVTVQPRENSAQSSLAYSNQITNLVQLVNNGSSDLASSSDPVIGVSLGSSMATLQADELYYADNTYTSCAYVGLVQGGVCYFDFNWDLAELARKMEYGTVAFSYLDNYPNPVNALYRLILSAGDFKAEDFLVTNWDSQTLNITKNNSYDAYTDGSSSLARNSQLKNFRLYLGLDSKLDIGVDEEGRYALGDYAQGYNLTQLVAQINADLNNGQNYDKKCFSDGFNFKYIDSVRGRACPLTLHFPSAVQEHKPIQFELYAEYDSPTQNMHLKQFIGLVRIVTNHYAQPSGPYTTSCKNILWDSTRYYLQADCPVVSGIGVISQWLNNELDYGHDCAAHSQVVNTAGHLVCVPGGNYLDSCGGVRFDGHTLMAKCQYSANVGQETSLSYSRLCVPNTSVSNNFGSLVCDKSAVPSGSYQQSCPSKDVSWNGNILSVYNCSCAAQNKCGSVLNYTQACAPGSSVSFRADTLVCDKTKID